MHLPSQQTNPWSIGHVSPSLQHSLSRTQYCPPQQTCPAPVGQKYFTAALIRRSACPSAADLLRELQALLCPKPLGRSRHNYRDRKSLHCSRLHRPSVAIVVETITDLCRSNTIIAASPTPSPSASTWSVRDGSTVIYGVWTPSLSESVMRGTQFVPSKHIPSGSYRL